MLERSDFSDTSGVAITKLLQNFVKCVRFGARVQGGGLRFTGDLQPTRIEGVSPTGGTSVKLNGYVADSVSRGTIGS